jgi:threonine/homoserine/homoserine lactone efflux protein
MSLNQLLTIALFTFSMSISPGPNNIMVTSSGANFGLKKTIPHLLGIWVGFSSLMVLSALGLKQIFDLYPGLIKIIQFTGISYMFFLAWKIAHSSSLSGGKTIKKPISFFQAVLFQIMNPKAVMMSITSMSVYTVQGDNFFYSALVVIIVFNLTGFPSTTLWALSGSIIGKKLHNEKFRRVFNYSLGGLTACSAILLII